MIAFPEIVLLIKYFSRFVLRPIKMRSPAQDLEIFVYEYTLYFILLAIWKADELVSW